MKTNRAASLDDWVLVGRVAEAGSLALAAQRLGMSHTTAFRRLTALEEQLGLKLFERRAGQYTTTAAGEALAQAGRTMQAEADAALLRVQGQDARPQGRVRVASTEGVIGGLLMPLLPALREALPDLRLLISAQNDFLNLAQREADLALRAAPSPPQNLIGQRVGQMRHAVYAQREMSQRFQRSPLERQPWIAMDDSANGSRALTWLSRVLPLEEVTLRFSGMMMVRSACARGLGLAVLPCFLGDTEPNLVRLGEPIESCDSELWLLSHPELRETVRVKALREWLLKALSTQAELLAGLRPRQP